jgi:hypothetical protein
MNRDSQNEELTRLISGLLDQRLSEGEHERLEALLAADPGARRLYMQMIDQEIELPCLVASVQGEAAVGREVPSRQNLKRRFSAARALWRHWIFRAAIAFGMVMLLALFAASRWFGKTAVRTPQPIASAPSLTDSWAEDFENGASTGWHGQLVTTNLPAGSKYGIAAVVKEFPGAESSYNIQLPEDWERGLVALTTGTTLHVTYRLGNRTHVNVFMHTISPEAGERKFEMYQLKPVGFPGRSGRWQTASIPFSGFVRKIVVEPGGSPKFVGGPPRAGEPITTLSFSSIEPSDLVIDRIWITPAGPDREEIVPLRNQTSP